MIYHLSLWAAGMIAGIFLLILGAIGLVKAGSADIFLRDFPRSKTAGAVLLAIAFGWSFWLLATMEMGEFSSFRRPLLFALPVVFILVLRFVDEFLAVRALGILALLAAEPLLDAAFFRYETTRLLVTTLAYLLIVAGLVWVTMPYLLRDQISWSARTTRRWILLSTIVLLYGGTLVACAFASY